MNTNGTVDIYIFSGFSNYFDRRIFFYNSTEDYIANSVEYEIHENINFNPADGVRTYLDVLTDNGDKFSYMLVVDSETDDIISRWFIIECDRNLGGQYRMQLKRDVVAESIGNNNFVINAPIFVEKGILNDNDPMIVNSENMELNQIKQSEIILNDPTGCGYIIGYIEKGASITGGSVSVSQPAISDFYTVSEISAATGISETKLNDMLAGTPVKFCSSSLSFVFGANPSENPLIPFLKCTCFMSSADLSTQPLAKELALSWAHDIGVVNTNSIDNFSTYLNTRSQADKRTALTDVIDNDFPGEEFYDADNYQKLFMFNGKIVKIGSDYFSLNIVQSNINEQHPEIVISHGENTLFNNAIAAIGGTQTINWEIYLNFKTTSAILQKTLFASTAVNYDISSSANSLTDAPYTMFAIPFGDYFRFVLPGNIPYSPEGGDRIITKEEAFAIAADITAQLQAKLYDIQLLPYLPNYDVWVKLFGTPKVPYFKVESKTLHSDFDLIHLADNTPIGLIIYPNRASFTQTLERTLTMEDSAKIESQCNFYRMCSPNYNGLFEFNLAKMGGNVSNFFVSATYKPISPFIKIAPQFSFLYGSNFNDGRGLICGGEFSLPTLSDAWVQYEQNNKNFANIFAREIENLDVSQRQERLMEKINLGSGIVAGTAGGAALGFKAGGGYGAIGGAVAGLGAGSIGAAIDAALGQERRTEQKDYQIDRFNMNLANIKAVPHSLTRISSFTLINKIFPFIEYYSCTAQEKEALRLKIQYDGMTVGRIGTINDFITVDEKRYFKGRLIRAVGIYEDSHFIDALYEEIAKGVYI